MDNNNYNDNNNNYGGGDYLPPESDGTGYNNIQQGSYDSERYGMNNPYDQGTDAYGFNNPYMNNGYSGSSYSSMYNQSMPPVDKNGKEIPNNYGMKLTFSILEIFTSTLFGILGLIFTIQQNTAYKNGDWAEFKSKRKISNIMLWIGFGFTMLSVILVIVMVIGVFSYRSEYNSILNDHSYDNDYTYDDSDYSGIYDSSRSDSDYPTGNSTLMIAETETITIDGMQATIPTDVKSFLAATGITTTEDLSTTMLDGDYDDFFYFSDDDYNYSFIDIYNTSDNSDYAINGYVGGIKLEFDSESAPSFEWRGITEQSSIQDMYDKLGNPDDASDYNSTTEFSYYGGAGWLSITFDADGKMTEFWLNDDEAIFKN